MNSKINHFLIQISSIIILLITIGCNKSESDILNEKADDNINYKVSLNFDFKTSIENNIKSESNFNVYNSILSSPDKYQLLILFRHSHSSIVETHPIYSNNDSLYTDILNINKVNKYSPEVSIKRIAISEKENPKNIVFSTVLKGYDFDDILEEEELFPLNLNYGNINDLNILNVKFIDTKISTPEKCGYKDWSEEYIKSNKIAYSVNICYPDNNEFIGHRIGNTSLILQRETFINSNWIKTGEPLMISSGPGELGIFTFEDYCYIKNSDERYILDLTIDNSIKLYSELDVESLSNPRGSGFWETPIGENFCTGYIHLDLCDIDLTKEGIIKEDANWKFYITKTLTDN